MRQDGPGTLFFFGGNRCCILYSDKMPDIAIEITTTAAWFSRRDDSQVEVHLVHAVTRQTGRSAALGWSGMPIALEKNTLGRIDSRMEKCGHLLEIGLPVYGGLAHPIASVQ
jgi:hypothetical protein